MRVRYGDLRLPQLIDGAMERAGLDGNIDALFSITANLTGSVSSGPIPLFQLGIPGLSFPG